MMTTLICLINYDIYSWSVEVGYVTFLSLIYMIDTGFISGIDFLCCNGSKMYMTYDYFFFWPYILAYVRPKIVRDTQVMLFI